MSTKTKDDTTLRMERVIAATPERLFALWSEPEELIKWWGPEGYTLPKHALDVRPGGRWRTTMRRPDGTDHTVSGIYRTIEPPKRLVFTWGWDDDAGLRGHETEVTVTIMAGVRVSFVWSVRRFVPPEIVECSHDDTPDRLEIRLDRSAADVSRQGKGLHPRA